LCKKKAGAKAISQLQVDEIADIYGVIKEYKEVFRSQRGLKGKRFNNN
jgi:hypothetical protein